MDHQDWKSVNVGSGPSVAKQLQQGTLKKAIVEKQGGSGNAQSASAVSAKKIEATEIGTLPTPSHDLSMQIQQARVAKKLTQVQLNQQCNFKKGTVADYECGKALRNPQELVMMSRVLGITLREPKK